MRNVANSIMWRGALSIAAGSRVSVFPRHINGDYGCYKDAKKAIKS
jgi:hypothetical protein